MHTDPWGHLTGDAAGLAGLVMIFLVAAAAVIGPAISPYSPNGFSSDIFSPPSSDHILGTDFMGQDILTRLLFGARTSLMIGLGAAIVSSTLSLAIGGTAALFGGLYDRIVMRFVDAMISMPTIIIAILVASYIRPSLPLLIALISFLSWPEGSRVIRAQVLSLKETGHVRAARTFGAGWLHILKSHIVPDLGPILVAIIIQDARRAIFMEAGLSFLGVTDPSMTSWGKMMHQALGFSYLDVWKWWLLPTGFALSITIMSLSFIGSALETALDPRLRRSKNKIVRWIQCSRSKA